MRIRIPASCLALLGLMILSSSATGQDEETEARAVIVSSSETSDGGPPVMDFQVMSADSTGGLSFFSSGDGPMMVGDIGMGMGPMDPLSMLSMGNVKEEIELIPDQQTQLDEIRRDYAARIKDTLSSMHEDGGMKGERGREIAETFQALHQEQQDAMRKVLLPHQIDRLEQIAIQRRMKAAGASGLLADKKIAEALGISEEQAEEIKTRAEKLAEELQRKIEALREETREELLQTLTAEQREKLQKMMGAKYEGELTPQFPLPGRVRQRMDRNRGSSDSEKPGEGD